MSKPHPPSTGPRVGAFVVAPCGRITYLSRVARRCFEDYFGRREDIRALPSAMGEWWESHPDCPACWDQSGRRLFITLIDRSRKGACGFLVEEGAIEDENLDRVCAEVLRLVRQFKSNPQIAAAMHMSRSAVKKRLEKINETLGVHSRIEAAFYAESLRHRLPVAVDATRLKEAHRKHPTIGARW